MRTKQGIVTSAKMQNTVTVIVHRYVIHPLYNKQYRVSKKFLADTNGHDLAEGDEVVIIECRPMSKQKKFKVSEVKKKAEQVSDIKEEEVELEMSEKKESERSAKNAMSAESATNEKESLQSLPSSQSSDPSLKENDSPDKA